MQAVLASPPPTEWAALRVWAADLRDRLTPEAAWRRGVTSLISLLDSEEDLRRRCPESARLVGQSARLLAEKIATAVP